MTTTPQTDAFIGDQDGTIMTEGEIAMCDFARKLERERDEAKKQISLMIVHDMNRLESDSVVGSCDCQIKTNEVKHHKPGCKYRLICERNEACSELTAVKADYRTITAPLDGHDCAECVMNLKEILCKPVEKDAQIVALRTALQSIASEASKIWLATTPAPDIARIEKIAEEALIGPPPAVVPLASISGTSPKPRPRMGQQNNSTNTAMSDTTAEPQTPATPAEGEPQPPTTPYPGDETETQEIPPPEVPAETPTAE